MGSLDFSVFRLKRKGFFFFFFLLLSSDLIRERLRANPEINAE